MTEQKLDKELKELKEFMQNYFEQLGKENQVDEKVTQKANQDFFNLVERYSKDYQVRFLTQLKSVSTK